MSTIRRFLQRLVHAFRPDRAEPELAREVASHLGLLEDEFVRQGMSPAEAHTAARRAIGGPEQVKIRHRDARSFRWLDELLADARQAWRTAIRNRRSSAAAVFILAVVGAVNALVFGLADAVLIRPLPYRDADRVFVVRMMNEASGQRGTRVGNEVLQLLAQPRYGLSRAGIMDNGPRITIDSSDGPSGVATASATPSYFEALGVRPEVGRLLTDTDTGTGGHVALLSYDGWQTHFGGRADIVGTAVTLGNTMLDVVGVLPPDVFLPTIFGDAPEVVVAVPYPGPHDDEVGAFYPVVRLDRGTTSEQAQAALTAVARVRQTATGTSPASAIPVLDPIRAVLFPAGRTIMRWLAACTLALVVLSGVNLAALFLVRGFGRERDTGVKLALGASRMRIIRPVLLEVMGICAIGGLSALVIARQAFDPLLDYVPRLVYLNAPVGIDLRVGAITVVAVTVAALLSTLLVTWFSSRRAVIWPTSSGRVSIATWRRGRVLVGVQIVLTVVLVFGAAITARAFATLLNVPLGFDPTNVLTAGMVTMAPHAIEYERITRSLAARPDVEAVGGAARMPFDGAGHDDDIPLSGGRRLGVTYLLPGYFEAIRRPLIRGRTVTWDDYRSDPGAVVVSEAAAHVLAPDGDPLGMSLSNRYGRPLHVVGVVADALYNVGSEPQATVYSFAVAPERHRVFSFVARTTHRSDVLMEDLRRLVADQVPGTRVHVGWWADSIFNVTAFRNPRFQTIVLMTLGGVALVLTMVGIVGVMGCLVAARTRELAVRTAIGATPGSLVWLVIRQGLVPVSVGLVTGLVATRWASRFAEAQLFAVDTTGVAALATTTAVVLVAAIVAALIPSRRAGRVDPVVALRAE